MADAKLEAELAVLESRLLADFVTEFPDAPSLEERILVNAYLVLAHACIEEHVEALFQLHADSLVCEDTETTVGRAVAAAVYAWHEPAKSKSYRDRKIGDIIKAGSAHVTKATQKNNGIKESNIEGLAKAAGVEWPPFDDACNAALIKLGTLGGKRGEVAHVSVSRTQITNTPVYPSDAKTWVWDAVAGASVISDYLEGSRKP